MQGFTNQLNLFDHIGDHSSFPGRENQGAKDSESHVNYDIPKCFDYNWWLLPEERCVTVFCGTPLWHALLYSGGGHTNPA